MPVIFDLDGTLVDPAGGITDGIASALHGLGLPVPGQDLLEAMIGPKLSDSLLNVAQVPAELLDEVIRRYREYYVATGIGQGRIYPGVREVLESFVATGRPIAVATQKPQGLARTVLEYHGIDGLFHGIHGHLIGYRALVQLLGQDHPVYGLRFPSLAGRRPAALPAVQ